jgi:hypothetical protein
MWTSDADGILVYAGGPHCPLDLNRWQTSPQSYSTTALGRTVWSQTCAPDYDIAQATDVGGGGYFGNFLQMVEDPVTKPAGGWINGQLLHSDGGI